MRQIGFLARSFAVAVFCLCPIVHTQEVDLCAIDRNPSQFCGKMITVRGSTEQSFGGLMNDRCETVLAPRTPENSGVRVRFKLKRDKSWQKFTHYDAMSTELRGGPLPEFAQSPDSIESPPPPNYSVTATFHGLFVCKRKQIPWFFLVVESVSDVKAEQVY
jgi:hypothetical protein